MWLAWDDGVNEQWRLCPDALSLHQTLINSCGIRRNRSHQVGSGSLPVSYTEEVGQSAVDTLLHIASDSATSRFPQPNKKKVGAENFDVTKL